MILNFLAWAIVLFIAVPTIKWWSKEEELKDKMLDKFENDIKDYS